MSGHVHDYGHDERCCMNGVSVTAGPHPDCPGRCGCGTWLDRPIGAVCPIPGESACLDQTPCPSCVSLGQPLPLFVGDEPFDDEPPGSPIFLPGGAA